MPQRMNPEDARQGRKGTPVLMILIVGLALCVLVFVGLGMYGWVMPDSTLETPVETGAERADPVRPDAEVVTQQPAEKAGQ